jgi:hypothetical protein
MPYQASSAATITSHPTTAMGRTSQHLLGQIIPLPTLSGPASPLGDGPSQEPVRANRMLTFRPAGCDAG